MSETVTEQVVTPEPTQVSDVAPQQDAPVQAAVEEVAQTPSAQTEETQEPPKPTRQERHIANLTRKAADEARARMAAETRAEAAEALLRAGREETDDAPIPSRQSAQTDVEARAAQLVAEREFTNRLSAIDAAGKKEHGADAWEAAKATMTSFGATANQAFLEAIAEAENPAKVFAALADDTDTLMDILAQRPTTIAARITRLDTQLGRPASRALSAAPTPPRPVPPAAVVPEPSIYEYPSNMSMKEWNKMMDNVLPPQLGGKRRTA